MDDRHSSPSSRASPSRPRTHRSRSNSFPLVDALGISTPEAELILAEGRAAVQSRHASAQRRGRRNRSENEHLLRVNSFHPQAHLKYLEPQYRSEQTSSVETLSYYPRDTLHTRIPSDTTDRSESTITGPVAPSIGALPSPALSPTSPLGDYSANLAKFIKTQLNSIASYHPMVYPRSCPDLSAQSRTPPLSPVTFAKRVDAPSIIEIPPVRPPLRSAFSAWSSTDDELDDVDDDVPPLPTGEVFAKDLKLVHDTPSILQYYESSNQASFLFSSTPPLQSLQSDQTEHPNAKSFSFPQPPEQSAQDPEALPPQYETDYPSSSISSRPMLTASSAPSSISTTSYFDCKRPLSIAPHIREQIIATISPHGTMPKVITATSPFEGGALATVHDVLIESQHRVQVDGLSFDLVNSFNFSNVAHSVPTPG